MDSLIPGTYIRESKHEFGAEYDTLEIAIKGGLYVIERRWKYERVLDGTAIEPEYKVINSTCILKDGILTEQESGVHFVFDRKANMLFCGSDKYVKSKAK